VQTLYTTMAGVPNLRVVPILPLMPKFSFVLWRLSISFFFTHPSHAFQYTYKSQTMTLAMLAIISICSMSMTNIVTFSAWRVVNGFSNLLNLAKHHTE